MDIQQRIDELMKQNNIDTRKISLGINQKYKTNSKFGVGKVKSFPTIFLTA